MANAHPKLLDAVKAAENSSPDTSFATQFNPNCQSKTTKLD